MEYSNLLTFFLLLILVLFVFVVMVNFVIPLKIKSDFDDISSSYHLLVQLEGGMSDSIRREFEKELMAIGLSDISLECKSIDEVRYGDKFEFYVSASIKIRIPNKFLVFEELKEKIEFKRLSFSKKLVN